MVRESLSQEMALEMHHLSDEKEADKWRAGGLDDEGGKEEETEEAGPRSGLSIVSGTTVQQ